MKKFRFFDIESSKMDGDVIGKWLPKSFVRHSSIPTNRVIGEKAWKVGPFLLRWGKSSKDPSNPRGPNPARGNTGCGTYSLKLTMSILARSQEGTCT